MDKDTQQPPVVQKVLNTYELLERIISHLGFHNPHQIILLQRVCTLWNHIINDSPLLQEACWFRPHAPPSTELKNDGSPAWRLNPAFNKIGIPISQEVGDFDLKKRIYDLPGSWCNMLVSQPPCKYVEYIAHGDYSADENMDYLVASQTEKGLLMGDVMAGLAEAQNRMDMGVDRWAGVRHYGGTIRPVLVTENDLWEEVLAKDFPEVEGVAVRVAVAQAWNFETYPAFSLRRVQDDSKGYLREMIVHEMVSTRYPIPYRWDGNGRREGDPGEPVCEDERGYKANLLCVERLGDPLGYTNKLGHVYKLKGF
ncbi:hypothetical protein QBC38DRAFT_483653 [Podospora fimiseda]|uniref:F-box domain-containing protein n=1 Tax=Podospora fimiseda TaxID=252190 RepID=A0AAN7BKW7_9PEZI|nr:hypothetical protein QBC38DRAFT_483653 [Podospora fimiseda]